MDQFDHLAIGLMSGTSLDGIDAALIRSNGVQAESYGTPLACSYTEAERNNIRAALVRAKELGHPDRQDELIDRAEKQITERHGALVEELLRQNSLTHTDIKAVGFHGQTLLHCPQEGWSWQVGDGALLARRLDIVVVNDFRRRDVSHGGQGSPLLPIYHQCLFGGGGDIAVINIGGVGNMTLIRGDDLLAFDTGPGNALIDDWVYHKSGKRFDDGGKIAAQGTIDEALVARWMDHPYFRKKPPKSLDRNSFETPGLDELSLADGAATLTAFTLESLLHFDPGPVDKWVICGGGRHNDTLMKMLRNRVSVPVELFENGDFIEAEGFAYLALRHLRGLNITFPGTTGIKQPSPGGILHQP